MKMFIRVRIIFGLWLIKWYMNNKNNKWKFCWIFLNDSIRQKYYVPKNYYITNISIMDNIKRFWNDRNIKGYNQRNDTLNNRDKRIE